MFSEIQLFIYIFDSAYLHFNSLCNFLFTFYNCNVSDFLNIKLTFVTVCKLVAKRFDFFVKWQRNKTLIHIVIWAGLEIEIRISKFALFSQNCFPLKVSWNDFLCRSHLKIFVQFFPLSQTWNSLRKWLMTIPWLMFLHFFYEFLKRFSPNYLKSRKNWN